MRGKLRHANTLILPTFLWSAMEGAERRGVTPVGTGGSSIRDRYASLYWHAW